MTEDNWLRKFARSRKDRWIGGVCGGLGEYTPVPSWTWRLIFTLFLFIWGTGLLFYLLLWIFAPEDKNGVDIGS